MNPEEMGDYAEGDILIPTLARNGVKEETLKWKNGHVPYEVDSSFSKFMTYKNSISIIS